MKTRTVLFPPAWMNVGPPPVEPPKPACPISDYDLMHRSNINLISREVRKNLWKIAAETGLYSDFEIKVGTYALF